MSHPHPTPNTSGDTPPYQSKIGAALSDVYSEAFSKLPIPRASALAQMESLAAQIGRTHVLQKAGSGDVIGFYIASIEMLVLGTACRRPLLCEEAEELRVSHRVNVAIVRGDDRDFMGQPTTTVDLLMADAQSWLLRMKPWRMPGSTALWLAPTQGEGRAVKFEGSFIAISPRAPFSNLFEREYGFQQALDSGNACGGFGVASNG